MLANEYAAILPDLAELAGNAGGGVPDEYALHRAAAERTRDLRAALDFRGVRGPRPDPTTLGEKVRRAGADGGEAWQRTH